MLHVQSQRLDVRPERRTSRRFRLSGLRPGTAARADNSQTAMAIDNRRDQRQVNAVVFADHSADRVRFKDMPATRTAIRPVIRGPVGNFGERAEITLVPRLRAARFRVLPPLLLVRRRGLDDVPDPPPAAAASKQAQPVFLRQLLKIIATHPISDSEPIRFRKGVGNYAKNWNEINTNRYPRTGLPYTQSL